MIHLITSFYQSEKTDELHTKRNSELLHSLKKNIENPLITKIHLYLDDSKALDMIKNLDKIHIIAIGSQPLYSELFDYAFDHLKNEICMISNSDIYLYECEIDCLHRLDNNIFALTRYEHNLSCPLIDTYMGSHDAFIFKSPLSINLNPIKHVQNVWGSENSVIDNLYHHGYKIYNPCFQIKIVHLHESGLRNEERIRIPGGHYLFPPILF